MTSEIQTNSPHLRNLPPDHLRVRVQQAVRQERQIMAAVLQNLAEVDRRRLYLDWGFGSLFEYLTRELGYSESAAYRRMQAARALRQIPEIQEKIQSGELNLSQIVQVQKDLRREERATGEKVSLMLKKEIFSQVCNRSLVETQKILDQHMSEPTEVQPSIEIRHRKDDSVDVTLNIPADLYQELQRMKELYSHLAPGADLIQILRLMSKDVRRMRDPLLSRKARLKLKADLSSKADLNPKEELKPQTDSNPEIGSDLKLLTPELNSKNATQSFAKAKVKPRQPIPAAVRRLIFQRDRGACSICGSRHQVEVDHIQPVFTGGSNEPMNLRLLCRSHNQNRYQKGAGMRVL